MGRDRWRSEEMTGDRTCGVERVGAPYLERELRALAVRLSETASVETGSETGRDRKGSEGIGRDRKGSDGIGRDRNESEGIVRDRKGS